MKEEGRRGTKGSLCGHHLPPGIAGLFLGFQARRTRTQPSRNQTIDQNTSSLLTGDDQAPNSSVQADLTDLHSGPGQKKKYTKGGTEQKKGKKGQ